MSIILRHLRRETSFFRAGYIESWGRGTIAITEECKEYGLPMPTFSEPFGGFSTCFFKLEQDTPQVTPQVTALIFAIQGEMTREELQRKLGLIDREHFRKEYLKIALQQGVIEMTIPEKPKSKNQKYRLSPKGISYVKAIDF